MRPPARQPGEVVENRSADPSIGGVVTSAILEWLISPLLYVIRRRRELPEKAQEAASFLPPQIVPSRQMRQRFLTWAALAIGVLVVFYTGNFAWQKLRPTRISGAPFITQAVNDLTVSLVNRERGLRQGNNEVMVEFR